MSIYLIKRNDCDFDDETRGHVIVANDEQEVRALAKRGCDAEGGAPWDIAEVTVLGKYTGEKRESFIVMTDNIW